MHQSIRQSDIKVKGLGLVVGIERNGQRHLNPESDWIFEAGDVVWLVGEKKKLDMIL
ncbi:MAG: TrkA C-terminal domain-containing protein [Ferruginibacter sp.]